MNGGTLGRAPIGYLNVTENIDERKINTVQTDPERAPFLKLAFELYASRDKTFADIAEELTNRGLRTRPMQRPPAGPISDSKIQQMLRDRYYLGEVRYKGERYPGRHEALIDEDQFNRVQELMDEPGYAAERRKRHDPLPQGHDLVRAVPPRAAHQPTHDPHAYHRTSRQRRLRLLLLLWGARPHL